MNQAEKEDMGFQSVLFAGPARPPVIPASDRWKWLHAIRSTIADHLGSVIIILVMSAAAYFLISRLLVSTIEIHGTSMEPTLAEHAHYFLNRWAFHDREPQRGEIVVLTDPEDHGTSVKRIVALPGESVYFKNGSVYVNYRKLSEPYLSPHTMTFTYSKAKEQLILCGRSRYFVLGDNRFVSIDSRSYGPVPRVNILGLVPVPSYPTPTHG